MVCFAQYRLQRNLGLVKMWEIGTPIKFRPMLDRINNLPCLLLTQNRTESLSTVYRSCLGMSMSILSACPVNVFKIQYACFLAPELPSGPGDIADHLVHACQVQWPNPSRMIHTIPTNFGVRISFFGLRETCQLCLAQEHIGSSLLYMCF
jgi:hypothetical protein